MGGQRGVPEWVVAAERAAAARGFAKGCRPEVGRLPAVAAAGKPVGVIADDERVRVLHGDWRLLEAYAPFDVSFCDGGGKREDPERVVELLAPGGVLVLDDFTPSATWPPRFEGGADELRLFYLTHFDLEAAEVLTTPTSSAILATRRERAAW
ncbi:transferase [Kitasatospora sp. NPDC001660]